MLKDTSENCTQRAFNQSYDKLLSQIPQSYNTLFTSYDKGVADHISSRDNLNKHSSSLGTKSTSLIIHHSCHPMWLTHLHSSICLRGLCKGHLLNLRTPPEPKQSIYSAGPRIGSEGDTLVDPRQGPSPPCKKWLY